MISNRTLICLKLRWCNCQLSLKRSWATQTLGKHILLYILTLTCFCVCFMLMLMHWHTIHVIACTVLPLYKHNMNNDACAYLDTFSSMLSSTIVLTCKIMWNRYSWEILHCAQCPLFLSHPQQIVIKHIWTSIPFRTSGWFDAWTWGFVGSIQFSSFMQGMLRYAFMVPSSKCFSPTIAILIESVLTLSSGSTGSRSIT